MKPTQTSVIIKMLFVMGPSGSGKTTLSQQLLTTYEQILGKQTVTLISLDPANYLSQDKHIEINNLVNIQDVMDQYEIGPNASIFYCMDFLLQNIEWLENQMFSRFESKTRNNNTTEYPYHLFLFDLPGQIQLYINSTTVKQIIERLKSTFSKKNTVQSCLLELFDCIYMPDINNFLSLCMMSLASMINLEMPHLNVLNKVDIFKNSQVKPNRGLINELFTVQSAAELVEELKSQPQQQYSKNIAQILDAYGQVSFVPCSLHKPQLVLNLIYELQKILGTLEISMYHPLFQEAVKQCDMFSYQRAITELQNELEQEDVEELKKMESDMNK